jgi:hypothetical protein
MSNGIDITIVGTLSEQPRPPAGIPGLTAPRGEDPSVVQERERRNEADGRRAAARHEDWRRRHEAWLQEQQERREAIATEAREAWLADRKEEKRRAYARAGVSTSEFEKMWPQLLRELQTEMANADPLADEKERIRSVSNYSM